MKDMPLTVRRSIELLGIVLVGTILVIGKDIIMPVIMAFFISIVLLPIFRFLRKYKFPEIAAIILPILRMQQLGFTLLATEGTAEILGRNGITARVVRKYDLGQVSEEGEPSIVDLINAGEVDIVINTPSGRSARADGYEIRTATVAADKPLFTTIAQLAAAVASIEATATGFSVRSLQDYALDRAARR